MRVSGISMFLGALVLATVGAGCAAKYGTIGDPCTTSFDCAGALLCVGGTCQSASSGPATYDNCSSTCNSSFDSCVLVMSSASTRMCSRQCTVGTDCPTSRDGDPNGVCLPVANGQTFCYSHCLSDSDCPSGWMCNPGTMRGAACTPR
jgi:hypothetical protein